MLPVSVHSNNDLGIQNARENLEENGFAGYNRIQLESLGREKIALIKRHTCSVMLTI